MRWRPSLGELQYKRADSRKAPPFEPPAYRGLTVLLAPVKAVASDRSGHRRPEADKVSLPSALPPPNTPSTKPSSLPDSPTPTRTSPVSDPVHLPQMASRDRSQTFSSSTTSGESYDSNVTATTAPTSVSSQDEDDKLGLEVHTEEPEVEDTTDVIMHPCESKRAAEDIEMDSDSDDMSMEDDDRPSCILLNALHVQDIFTLPQATQHREIKARPAFREAKLPQQINLRNLHIQQIKYATISDVIIYCKGGVGDGVLDVAEM